jgi:hypothetical protein
MQDCPNYDLVGLIDKLSRQTAIYYEMLTNGCSEVEYRSCRETITQLQEAIEQLKKTKGDNTVTNYSNE